MEKLIFEANIKTAHSAKHVQRALTNVRKVHRCKLDFDSVYNFLIIEGTQLARPCGDYILLSYTWNNSRAALRRIVGLYYVFS